MGKKGKAPDKKAPGVPPATAAGAPPPKARPGVGIGAGGSSNAQRSDEAGLLVFMQKKSAPYIAVLCFVTLVLTFLLLAMPSLPHLLAHWSLLIFALFIGPLVVLRCQAYFSGSDVAQERAAWLVFWGMLMVHGLVWLSLVLVLAHGTSPRALWRAFGEHGGAHLDIACMGAGPLLVMPPLLLLGFMAYERKYLVCIYHDFFQASGGAYKNAAFQICSPLLPLALWAALLRPPIFTDLPEWPPLPELLGVCALVNVPILLFIQYSTRHFHGPAHWMPDGAVAVFHAPPSLFRQYYR